MTVLAAMSWSWLDALLVVILLAYAVSGFRAGLLVSASSLTGFIGGGALALWVLPFVLAWWKGWSDLAAITQWLLLLAVLIVAATCGQWVGLTVGNAMRRRVSNPSGQLLDALAGALVVVVTTALVAWFLGGAARLSGQTTLSSWVGRSAILTGIDEVVPVRVGSVLAGVNGIMTGHGFPRVFDSVGREPITEVAAPDAGLGASEGIAAAAASVLRIDGEAAGCSSTLEGSGWVFAPRYVVTNAHVVSGTDEVTVRVPGTGRTRRATVVLHDTDRDIAILHVPGLTAPPLPLGGVVGQGDSVAALGYPLAGPYAVEPARVRERLVAHGLDIHGTKEVTREVYSLRAEVQPGNSGGPLVDDQGQVVGVIFARSLDDPQTGYALTLGEVAEDLAMGTGATAPVDTGTCVRN